MKRQWIAMACFVECALGISGAKAQTSLTWVDFGATIRGKQEAPLRSIVLSERPGDAALAAMDIKDGAAQIVGHLSAKNGSGWTTLGMEFGRSPDTVTSNMATYRNLRIRLFARSGPVYLNNFPRFISGLWAGC